MPQTPNPTPAQHAHLGSDYLDELLQSLQANRWCFVDSYGIERKISAHAEALGIATPLERPSKPEHETEEELQIWLRMHDPLTDSVSERLIARMVFAPPPASKGTVLRSVYRPMNEMEQAAFRQFTDHLKREMQRRAAHTPTSPAPSTTGDDPTRPCECADLESVRDVSSFIDAMHMHMRWLDSVMSKRARLAVGDWDCPDARAEIHAVYFIEAAKRLGLSVPTPVPIRGTRLSVELKWFEALERGAIDAVCRADEGSDGDANKTVDAGASFNAIDGRETCVKREQTAERASACAGSEVFLSYARKDDKWRGELQTMLAPALRTKTLDLWYDGKVRPSADWRKEIEAAMTRAKVGVLLVTKHFLASDFIANNELPFMVDAAKRHKVKLTWLLVSDAMFEGQDFTKLQALHDVGKPLSGLRSNAREKVLKQIAQGIVDLVR